MCSACSSRTNACCSPQAPHACGFFLSYADQSGVSGALVHTNVAIAGITVPLTVAAVLAETKGFENTQVDGILGMAYSPLACNPTCIMPLFDTLVNARVVKRDVFSICTASNGGTLTLGGSNPNFYHGKLAYVPLASRFHLFYDISLTGVEIGGRTVDIPYFNHAIVDSGTTVMVVTNRAFKALKHHFQSNYCNVPGLCVHQPSSLTQQQSTSNVLPRHLVSGHTTLSNSSTRVSASWFDPYFCANLEDRHIAMLPDIVIKLENNVRIVLEPDVYMIKYEKADTFGFRKIVYRCLGISSFQGMDLVPNNVILGNTVLQKYFVEYDRENSRLGFAVAKNCVDPNVKAAESSTFLGRLGSDTMRQWMARIFTVAAILAWVVVVFLCTRKTADDGERYTPIPATY